MSKSILVVGAGELGIATLKALTEHPKRNGAEITVLLRADSITSTDAEKQARITELKSLGINIEAGDFINDPDELIPVFKKYDIVIQCAGYGMRPGTQLGVTKAVLEACVPRYFPWQFGVDYDAIGKGSSQDLFDEMLEVRALLRAQSTTSWTIISTGLFMSYLFLPEFGVVDLREKIVRALGNWDVQVTITYPEDIGIMIAEAVFVPEDTVDRVVYIGGDTISYGRLANLLEEILKTSLKREEWSIQFLRAKLQGTPNDLWAKYQNIFGDGIGVSWPEEKMLNHQRNVKLKDIATYAQENKESLYKSEK